MSDMEEYVDPALEELLRQLVEGGGYQPFGANMSVPYTQDYMGGNTDPTRQWKSQDTMLKSQEALMGFSPIEGFAGPQPELWIPGTEQLANEVIGDEDGEKLLDALDQGAGVLALQKQIADQTYDPKNGEEPSTERPLSPQQAAVYRDWLERYSKAQAEDYIKLGQPGTVTDPMELDPMGDVAAEPDRTEDQYISQLVKGGAFGEQRSARGAPSRVGVAPSRQIPQNTATPGRRRSPGYSQAARYGTMGDQAPRGEDPVVQAIRRGNSELEGKYRQDFRAQASNTRRPSMAKERAYRAIVAYRMAHGMSPR
jgi:hypothetical protein